jgi:hypothetical protein
MKTLLIPVLLLVAFTSIAQPRPDYTHPFVCTSQLGFRITDEKTVTLYGGTQTAKLPAEISFYIQPIGHRLPREQAIPKAWEVPGNVFRYPIDIAEGKYPKALTQQKEVPAGTAYMGVLRKTETRWGTIWRGDFSDFVQQGFYQIETQYGFTVPFVVEPNPFERLQRGYLEFMYMQRSGVEIPGVRPVEHGDDARFYSDETRYLPVAGGWNDAGDFRKWLFLTQPNLEALAQIATKGHPGFRQKALAEMRWGNQYFHHMVSDAGQVYEDVGGGVHRGKADLSDWWNENHPGVTASGDMGSDNIPMNGDERHIRDTYNPLVQLQFVRYQAVASQVLPPPDQSNCLVLADRAWRYHLSQPHDRRTLFLAEELLAALELYQAGSPNVKLEHIKASVAAVLERQEQRPAALTGYFLEANGDGYRSIAFSAEPALALLRLLELNLPGTAQEQALARQAVLRYANGYLLADARSNPFGITPYGIYSNPPNPGEQTFREAGLGRKVRTFIHLFSPTPMPHGCGAVHLAHGYFLARAGAWLNEPAFTQAAMRLLNWSNGHNPAGLCLNTSIGFKHPVPAHFGNYRIPETAISGFMGHPDDTPYLETSNAIEWSTQEVWDVPYYYTIGIISYLK